MTRRNRDTLREDYLHWLEPQLKDNHDNPGKTYWELLNIMFETKFRWSVAMDENRAMDGLDLRIEFARQENIRSTALEFLGPASFLEVLIALSKQMAFIAGGDAPGWSWVLLSNLELQRMYDPLTRPKRNKVADILDMAMERTYNPDGTGGFFPLAWPEDDMTNIELWYQMHAYVEELHPEH
jgi:hypothetical protein